MKAPVGRAGRVLGALFAVASCVPPGGTTVPQITRVAYYPQCYRSVELLRYQDEQFARVMAANIVAGAAAGALAGAAASRRDSRGALIGAALGGLIAANMTYASIRLQQQPNDELRRGLIASDMNNDSSELQRAVVAARQADYCYDAAYYQLVAALRSGALSKAEATQRFTEIDQGERELAAILAEYGKKTAANVQEYEFAFNQEAERSNVTPAQLLAAAGALPVGTRRMVQNYRTLSQQTSALNQAPSSLERKAGDRRNYMHSQQAVDPSG